MPIFDAAWRRDDSATGAWAIHDPFFNSRTSPRIGDARLFGSKSEKSTKVAWRWPKASPPRRRSCPAHGKPCVAGFMRLAPFHADVIGLPNCGLARGSHWTSFTYGNATLGFDSAKEKSSSRWRRVKASPQGFGRCRIEWTVPCSIRGFPTVWRQGRQSGARHSTEGNPQARRKGRQRPRNARQHNKKGFTCLRKYWR